MESQKITNLDDLLDLVQATPKAEEIPEPGEPGNEWFGMNRFVNGQRQFYAFSGAERRRIRRANERAAAAETAKGQRAYNRSQRKRDFDAGTIRQQLRILKDELKVPAAMRRNLETHILRQTRINEAEETASDRKHTKAARREARLFRRRHVRVEEGRARHSDLVALGLREA